MAIASVELREDYLTLRPVEREAYASVYEVVSHGPDVEIPAGSYVVINELTARNKLTVGGEVFELVNSRNVVGIVELAMEKSA